MWLGDWRIGFGGAKGKKICSHSTCSAGWRWSLSSQWMPPGIGAWHKVTGEGSLEGKIHVIHWRWVIGKWDAVAGDLLQSWRWDGIWRRGGRNKNLYLASLLPGWRVLQERNIFYSENFQLLTSPVLLDLEAFPCLSASFNCLFLPVSCSLLLITHLWI